MKMENHCLGKAYNAVINYFKDKLFNRCSKVNNFYLQIYNIENLNIFC